MSAPSQSTAERLRVYIPLASDDEVVLASVATFKEAADEIDRLTAEVAKLRKALTPFAEIADWYEGHVIGDGRVLMSAVGRTTVKITLGQCRAARDAMPKEPA